MARYIGRDRTEGAGVVVFPDVQGAPVYTLPYETDLLAQYDASVTDSWSTTTHLWNPIRGSSGEPLQSINSSGTAAGLTAASNQNNRAVISSGTSYGFRAYKPAATTYSAYTVILCGRINTQSYPVVFGTGALGSWNGAFEIAAGGGAGVDRLDFAGGAGNDRTASATNIANADGSCRVIGWAIPASGVANGRVCTSLTATPTMGTSGTPGTYSAALYGNATCYGGDPTNALSAACDVDMCELLLFSSDLSQTNLDAIADYLANKWGAART